MKINNALPILILWLFSACTPQAENSEELHTGNDIPVQHARLFEIKKNAETYTIKVFSKERKKSKDYSLTSAGEKLEDAIHLPVGRIICLSTTHLGFINRLDAQELVVGIGGADYVYDSKIRKAIAAGQITDVGYEGNLNWEKIIDLQPDLITGYRVEGEYSKTAEMAERYGIPYINIAEYLEPSVLGQTEWIKVFGLLTGKLDTATFLFDQTAENYLNLKNRAKNAGKAPSVLLNLPWKGSWYVPGGASNMANLIADAGGDYLFKNNDVQHNTPMSVEKVFETAADADFWLNPGQADNLQAISRADERLTVFRSYKNASVYNRNARISASGGNDYMESGLVYPDKILSDLMRIFHPDIHRDSFYYYKQLK